MHALHPTVSMTSTVEARSDRPGRVLLLCSPRKRHAAAQGPRPCPNCIQLSQIPGGNIPGFPERSFFPAGFKSDTSDRLVMAGHHKPIQHHLTIFHDMDLKLKIFKVYLRIMHLTIQWFIMVYYSCFLIPTGLFWGMPVRPNFRATHISSP